MFSNVTYKYDNRSKTYQFSAWTGTRFLKALNRIGISDKKIKHLFISYRLNTFTVHRFYLPDIHILFTEVYKLGSFFGVNFSTLSNVIRIIETEITPIKTEVPKHDMDLIGKKFKYEPLPSQKEVYASYLNVVSTNISRGMLLDAAIGSGKTYMSLSLSVVLHSDVTLIVCPLSTLDSVWVSSISGSDTLFKDPVPAYVVGRDKGYSGQPYLICHYENMPKVYDIIKEYNVNVTTMIVDEIHNFNNIKAKQTSTLIDLINKINPEHVIPMSGTPIKEGAGDLLPLFMLLYTDMNKKVIKSFMNIYTRPNRLLKTILMSKYLSVTKTIAKDDIGIPELTTPSIRLKLKNGAYYTLERIAVRLRDYIDKQTSYYIYKYNHYAKIYNKHVSNASAKMNSSELDMLSEYNKDVKIIINSHNNGTLNNIPEIIARANEFEKKHIESKLSGNDLKDFRNAKSVYKYISLKVQGEALANIVMRARIECYSELAGNKAIPTLVNSSSKKTIIFSNYVDVCAVATETCVNNEFNPITVYGDTTKDLTRNVGIFINNDKINPLVTTYKSLSTGVPIVVANTIILLGLPHRQYTLDQAIGRAWRTGQDTPVTAYVIELDTGDKPNISDRDFDIIDFYRKEVELITGKKNTAIIKREVISEYKSNGIALDSDTLTPIDAHIINKLNKTKDAISKWL